MHENTISFIIFLFSLIFIRFTRKNLYRGSRCLTGLYLNFGKIIELKSKTFIKINANQLKVYKLSFSMKAGSFDNMFYDIVDKVVETSEIGDLDERLLKLGESFNINIDIKIKHVY